MHAQLPTTATHLAQMTPRVNTRTTLDAAEVDASRKLLEQRIALYGMEEREVDGDGNWYATTAHNNVAYIPHTTNSMHSQFRALAHQLLGTQHAHATIRAVVINQLRYVSERYQPHVPDSYDNYLEAMARDGTWGDHVTLQAAADAYNARIVILTSYDATAFVEIQPSTPVERVAFLSFWAELHYNALCVAEDSSLSDWTVTDEDVELQPWQRPWNVRRRWRVPTRDQEQLGDAGVLDRLFVAAPDWLRYGIG